MAATPPELASLEPVVLVSGPASRALVKELGTTAWSVLLDVSLDALPDRAGWTAKTSVRLIADHLGLTPGTVARALARLRVAGFVRRLDRRDDITGRFVESVYVVAPGEGIVPCVDCPHTVARDTGRRPGPDPDAANGDAGQPSPFPMASVCRSPDRGGETSRPSDGSMSASLGADPQRPDRARMSSGDPRSTGERRSC
ncbi:MAG: winged helix-turn-helix transcriptional regulator [Actinobacteria bacterium]|nr:winged helix-turn-helix transcriptional regulator [Actinomycetota bacterium]